MYRENGQARTPILLATREFLVMNKRPQAPEKKHMALRYIRRPRRICANYGSEVDMVKWSMRV
jgi:hypothetical protein